MRSMLTTTTLPGSAPIWMFLQILSAEAGRREVADERAIAGDRVVTDERAKAGDQVQVAGLFLSPQTFWSSPSHLHQIQMR